MPFYWTHKSVPNYLHNWFYCSYMILLQTAAIFQQATSVVDTYCVLYGLSNINGKIFIQASLIPLIYSVLKIM
jgi:hypothetical protein